MTIQELIDELQGMLDEGLDPETMVRIAIQPTYPMVHELNGVMLWEGEADEDDEGDEKTGASEKQPVVMLQEGSWVEYGSSGMWG